MAPEQARGDKVDERADVYAVGAVLYRAVTGHKPFDGPDPMATLTAVLVEEPLRPCARQPDLPPALELVIQRAMAKKPRERYASMAELERELAPFDAGSLGADAVALQAVGGPRARTVITGAGGAAADTTARTVLAGDPALALPDGFSGATQGVRLARPAIIAQSVVGFVCLLAGIVDTLAAGIRISSQGRATLTAAEVSLTVVGALLAVLTPSVLWVRYLRRDVWRSSPRAMSVADRLRRTLLLGAAAYGATALFVHVLEVVVRRDAAGIAWPGWNIVLFLIAASVSAASWFGPGLLQRRR
jgi:serine/threonine-protein kinase